MLRYYVPLDMKHVILETLPSHCQYLGQCWAITNKLCNVVCYMLNKQQSQMLSLHDQGAYRFGKMKFPEFPGFTDPLISLFQTIIKWKPDVTSHLSSQFGSFLEELQNIIFKQNGDWLHLCQSLCHPTNLKYCYWQLCTRKKHLINSLSKF